MLPSSCTGAITGAVVGFPFGLTWIFLGALSGYFLIDREPANRQTLLDFYRRRQVDIKSLWLRLQAIRPHDLRSRNFWRRQHLKIRRFFSAAAMVNIRNRVELLFSELNFIDIRGKLIGAAAGLLLLGPLGFLIGGLSGHFLDDDVETAREIELNVGPYHQWWGKILGVLLGMAAGGFLIGFFGLIGGHYIDRLRRGEAQEFNPDNAYHVRPEDYIQETPAQAFTHAIIVLSAKMARTDGRLSRSEISAFRRMFDIPPETLRNFDALFSAASQSTEGFEEHAQAIADVFDDSEQMREALLNTLFAMATADKILRPAEIDYLYRISRIFSLPAPTFDRLKASYENRRRVNPYDIIGVSPQAADNDIKQKWKQLLRENHPDTLTASGMPSEFVEIANKKVAVINAAYDQIAKERGMK